MYSNGASHGELQKEMPPFHRHCLLKAACDATGCKANAISCCNSYDTCNSYVHLKL